MQMLEELQRGGGGGDDETLADIAEGVEMKPGKMEDGAVGRSVGWSGAAGSGRGSLNSSIRGINQLNNR